MAWITLDKARFYAALSGPEANDLEQTALDGSGQTEPIDEVLADVSLECRGRVAACGQNQLDSVAGTIPDELEGACIIIARHRLLTRAGVPVDEGRVAEYREAKALLRDVALCKLAIAQPTTPTTDDFSGTAGIKVVAKRDRHYTRANLVGL